MENKANENGAGNTFTVSDHTDELDAYLLAKCDDCGATWRCDKLADYIYLQDVGCGCEPETETGSPGAGWQLLFDVADDEALTHSPFDVLESLPGYEPLPFGVDINELFADAEIAVSEI